MMKLHENPNFSPRIREWLRKNPPPPIPEHILRKKRERQAVLLSKRMAEAAKANPDSVRVSVKASDGVVIIERAYHERPDAKPSDRRQYSQMVVLEVDSDGRPLLAQHYDPATNTTGVVKYQEGYAQSGARHEYNPLDALKGKGDE